MILILSDKDLLIALIGISGGILSIFGGFLLSIAFSIRKKTEEIEFEMQLMHLEILEIKEEIPIQLVNKIIKFEKNAHRFSKYLKDGSNFINSKYTSLLDFSEINRKDKENVKRIKQITQYLDLFEYSKDFEQFSRWINLSSELRNCKDYKDLYLFLSNNSDFRSYSKWLNQQAQSEFSIEELEVYQNYIETTKVQRSKLWNLNQTIPKFKNNHVYFYGIVYLMLISFTGIIYPFYNSAIPKEDSRFLILCICVLTFLYIYLVYRYSFSSNLSKEKKKELKKYYF